MLPNGVLFLVAWRRRKNNGKLLFCKRAELGALHNDLRLGGKCRRWREKGRRRLGFKRKL